MGINGLWDETRRIIGPMTTTLVETNAEFCGEHGRPMRIAIDASILIYKFIASTRKAAKYGGMNHPSRQFLFFLAKLMKAGLLFVLVFDGPGRPDVKRGRPRVNHDSIVHEPAEASSLRSNDDVDREYEFGHVTGVVKQAIKLLGISFWDAPGEAEAECAALERAGIVDGIFTTDGDVLAFGGQNVLVWISELVGQDSKANDILIRNIDARRLNSHQFNRSAWILLALLAGGDYNDGLKGCGTTTASRLLASDRGKLASDLASIWQFGPGRERETQLSTWRAMMAVAIRAFSGSAAGNINGDFPKRWVVELYINPKVTAHDALQLAESGIWSVRSPRFSQFRAWTTRWFDWKGIGKAKRLMFNFAPGFLARELVLSGQAGNDSNEIIEKLQLGQKPFRGKSTVVPTVNLTFKPLHVIPIDWKVEKPLHCYNENEHAKYDPTWTQTETMPEFLARYGAAGLFTPSSSTTTIERKRKQSDVHSGNGEFEREMKTPRTTFAGTVRAVSPRTNKPPKAQTNRSTPAFKVPRSLGSESSMAPGWNRIEFEIIDLT